MSAREIPSTQGKLFAILVTYRRQRDLALTLQRLADQTRQPDRLLVMDNAPSGETEDVVRRAAEGFSGRVDYLPMPENLGYTGAVAAGMTHLLSFADDRDWVVVCDDDDPPTSPKVFTDLVSFAEEMLRMEPRTAAVGLGGGRFDFRRGRIIRIPTSELHGPVPLDYIAGNFFGCYRVSAIRDVGTWSPQIFFGFSEGEFGLRLRRAGYTLWGHGDIIRARRIAEGRDTYDYRPARRLPAVGWRRYYSLRNLIWILRQHGRTGVALRVSILNGIGKPLVNLPFAPRLALGHLRLNARAIRDGWTDRMGRQVEPVPWGPRPEERAAVRSR